MDLHAWGQQRAAYSRARRGRTERGAAMGECALIQGVTQAMGMRGASLPLATFPVFGAEQAPAAA
ncbi:MAG: hypothetical protein ACR2HV_11740 [Acidimicrobiales bacterium]